MTKQERIIAAYNCVNDKLPDRRCENCPYSYGYLDQSGYNSPVITCNTEMIMADAITLIYSQIPRVYNAGDFFGEEFGYLEYRTDRPGFSNFEPSPILIGDIDEENVTVIFRSASAQKLPLDTMNKNWRIWSDYPTHEQLRRVKWE